MLDKDKVEDIKKRALQAGLKDEVDRNLSRAREELNGATNDKGKNFMKRVESAREYIAVAEQLYHEIPGEEVVT